MSALGQESCENKTKRKSEIITSKDKQLKIWFINCDVSNTSKQQELCSRVATNSSDTFCLLEVKPKNFSRSLNLVEYEIDGYLLEQNNILLDSGRGTLLYIKNIQCQKLDISSIANNNPSEIIAAEFIMKERIILARVCRSPNSSPDNSININKSLEILSRPFSSNLCGRFQLP